MITGPTIVEIVTRKGTPGKTAFFSVVFPGVAPFFQAFLESLNAQTDKDFDLYLFNDGWVECESLVRAASRLERVLIVDFGCPSAEIRPRAISFLEGRGHVAVVFGDADDCFAEDRIEKVCRLLEKAEMVVNDLSLIDAEGRLLTPRYLANRFAEGAPVTFEHLRCANMCGLTNMAVRASVLPSISALGPADDLIALDWFWFGALLFRGCGCMFTTATVSFYRQYEKNLAGLGALTASGIRRGIEVKVRHYRRMATLVPEMAGLAERFAVLGAHVDRDPAFSLRYLDRRKAAARSFPLWWEDILDKDEEA